MTDLLYRIGQKYNRTKTFTDFQAGDTVGVYVKVKEGEKERLQLYEGIVTMIKGSGTSRTFTVRKISAGVGVERTFPFVSPAVDKVEVLARGDVRRSRLFYLRDLKGRAARLTSELYTDEAFGAADEAAAAAAVDLTPEQLAAAAKERAENKKKRDADKKAAKK